MSQTSTSHTQWIQHAVAAAKAGNPSVAKIQLQKAAEAAPSDPAVWLWMGWLADSPASAAQCLELARSDERFQQVADAGIAFATALAKFQLEVPGEVVADIPAEAAAIDPAESGSAIDPVEAVEEVAAVVETLQQEDATDLAITSDSSEPSASDDGGESAVSESVEQDNQPAETALAESDDSNPNNEQPVSDDGNIIENPTSGTTSVDANDVEIELMRSANELWLTPEVATDPAAGTRSEVVVDESEDDFAFASGEDAEFKAFVPLRPNPTKNSRSANTQSENQPDDQWLGQAPAKAPAAPVWRKAQSDWFGIDALSDPEPDQSEPAPSTPWPLPAAVSPAIENPEAVLVPEVSSEPVEQPSNLPSSTTQKPDNSTFNEATVVSTQEEATAQHRVTASDVWQTAAIEKSTLSEAQAIHMPVYQPAATPPPSEADTLSTSLEDVALQSPVNTPADFSSAAASDSPFLAGNTTADSAGRKTVLVVDDSPTVRKLVSITLEKRGYKVASAFDGVAAIKEIAAHNPALILMDVNMPRLDGYQLCKLVKKHETTCDIPVLMLSGTDGMFDRLRGRLVGCAGHVTKPFTPEVLIDAVEQHITHGKEA